ncbi:bifunctional ATP-dependent DNA helicase/DNA polymerase III subunit epsilon [Desulfosporosinus acididurans]|uniref:Bifunctional ATP-dependent DNA helicase/DNA polymerase III subunit epsilon n=1 Tax=Desulfosporosinus acididurans TaxID=476652 RepID=A0A0J1FQH7_9FIRM|nr:ATP-dependent DNA helicase [Desulfosporosinus acididurans]KLU65537.1 bifunctional ATP-dependent DNA helicase/DNA polymerase III subunit epsilon [Desulfosporosinus acididurans]
MKIVKVSVRELVEFVLKKGDLKPAAIGAARTQDGIKAHQLVQRQSGTDYLPEVTLSYLYVPKEKQIIRGVEEDICLEVKGRADGILKRESGACVDEIKTTAMDLTLIDESISDMHWAQAQCYAFMYAAQEGLETIDVQLTYYQLDTAEIRKFNRSFAFEQLSEFFINLGEKYLLWACRLQDWYNQRDSSIQELQFPFSAYRKGQRELAVGVYQTIKSGQTLFAQAPTGIGKTMGTLFPAIKAMGEGLTVQIFYLTAKTITRTVAEKALTDLQVRGLKIKRLTLTAKKKVCFQPESSCLPEECPFAKGYYDRLRGAAEDIFAEESWTRQVLEDYARKHSICPFEFSLEMATWADVVIGDYNYVFDPRVYLKRFFLDGGDYTFLVDEAHNLVERAREMFSAEIRKENWLELKRLTKVDDPKLSKSLARVNMAIIKEKKACLADNSKGESVEKELPSDLIKVLRHFVKAVETFLKYKDQTYDWQEQLLDLYFQALTFLRTAESFDSHYVTCLQSQADLRIKLFCLDPSVRLREALERGRASILFSATLSPMDYFMNVLGGEETSFKLRLSSPFPAENLHVVIHKSISTKYRQRASSYEQIAETIAAVTVPKEGNYLVFFPSYEYLQEVCFRFQAQNPLVKVIQQRLGMQEEEREEFLASFSEHPHETLIGFALMGGIFGEGIDLMGDRLSGAIVVGVGLPQVGFEREIIRDYYEKVSHEGFEFSYIYPGINKVLQAVGRVIRTEKDRGIVVLIDERFAQPKYKRLLPSAWRNIRYVTDIRAVQQSIENFWSPMVPENNNENSYN